MKTAITNLSKQNPLMLAAGAALLVWVVYSLARKTIDDVAKGAGGIFSGNNAVTKDTAYEGAGLGGTLGAAADSISGGLLSGIGGWLGGLGNNDTGEMLYYSVTFPDGSRHSVGSRTVSASGAFTYEGKRYVMSTQGGKRVARAA